MQDSSFRKASLDIGSSSLCQYNIASAALGPYQGFHLKLYYLEIVILAMSYCFISKCTTAFFLCFTYCLCSRGFFIYTEVDILTQVNMNFSGCRCPWKKVLGPQNRTSYLYFCLHQCIYNCFWKLNSFLFVLKAVFFKHRLLHMFLTVPVLK